MVSTVPSSPARTRALRPSVGRLALILGLSVFGLAACTDGPGDEADLVTALTRDDTFTTAEAECIAAAVFGEYGEDEDAIGKISGLGTFEELTGAEGVEGFDTFFSGAVRACTNT